MSRLPFAPRPSLALPVLLVLLGVAVAAPTPVVVTGAPAAPPLTNAGNGLCTTSAISTNPAGDFGATTPVTYNAVVNAFLEAHTLDRVTSVQRTLLDLSNNNTTGLKLSFGDFTDSMLPTCATGGCDFFVNDTTSSFASRLRGYLNVTPALAGKALHFGFYTDDAGSFVIYDRAGVAYPVVTRPPVLGAPTWRTTNSVTFNQPGLYAVEILYLEIVEHAALELSILDGAFIDYELPANQMGSTSLKAAGYQLLLASAFFGTENGLLPFVDPGKCQQCNRQFANLPGNGDCGNGSSYYCNGAALCAPCDSSLFCGPACSPCGQSTPHCFNLNGANRCVACRSSSDCQSGFQCDAVTHDCVRVCNTVLACGPTCTPCATDEKLCVDDGAGSFTCAQCRTDDDCERGRICDARRCVPCATRLRCAGASCNCCAGTQKCAPLNNGALPTCIECVSDGDCSVGRTCDTVNGRCVTGVPTCNTDDRCGPSCLRCPADRPICLVGQVCVECRSDLDCGGGKFCLSGQCVACATDRRCGTRCLSCAGDTPFCQTDGTAANSRCVRCQRDGDCGPGEPQATGNRCDRQTTGLCSAPCTVSCGAGTYCFGSACVDCYASSQCPCGGSCDPARHICTSACSSHDDCQGSEYCTTVARICKPGHRKPDETPAGGGPCCTPTVAPLTDGASSSWAAALVLLVSLLLLSRARRRRRR